MGVPSLVERTQPWVVVTGADDPWVTAEIAEVRAQGVMEVRLNASELREPETLFRAFARELSFPDYFGHNWDALADCLSDPLAPWLREPGGHGLALLIDGADLLLDVEHLGLFVAVLCQAAWRAHVDPGPAVHFVLLLDEVGPDAFEPRLGSRQGVTTEMVDGRLTATLTTERRA